MLFQINPVLILVPVKIIQSIAPPCVYDIIILYLLAAVHRIVRFESEIKSKSSAYNGLGTQNEFLNHAPLIGLRLISELNAAHGLRPKREQPYGVHLLRRQHTLDDFLRADARSDSVKTEPQQHSHIMRDRCDDGIVNACPP